MSKAQKAKSDTDIAEAKETAVLKATEFIQEYMDERYVKSNTTVASQTTGAYVAAQMNNKTSGSYTFTTNGTALTVSKSGIEIVTGTIGTDGKITWDEQEDLPENAVKNLAKQPGTIKVGDYVKYTAPSNKNITIDDEQTGYSSDQTFNTTNETMTWRVLSVNNTTGEVKIVGSPTSAQLYLYGEAGFGNAETVLNNIAGIFGGGTGAASARSITEDDLFDAIGYDKAANYVGGTQTYTSGKLFTETWDETTGTATYSTTTTTATEQNPITLHNTEHDVEDPNGEWRGGIKTASETLEAGTEEEKADMQIIWDMLIGGNYNDVASGIYTGCFNYWCASRYAVAHELDEYNNSYYYEIRHVVNGGIEMGKYIYPEYKHNGQYEYGSRSIVPVITLQSNIGIEKDNEGKWTFVTE